MQSPLRKRLLYLAAEKSYRLETKRKCVLGSTIDGEALYAGIAIVCESPGGPIFKDPVTDKIAKFLIELGIDVRSEALLERTFLPGVTVINGVIVADEPRLLSGGDLLHEAGHLAIIAPAQRSHVNGDAGVGQELSATAWSYAAALHLGLDGSVVFHPMSFKGEGPHLLEIFRQGRFFGVPMLQRYGMTVDENRSKALGVPPYPHMLRWLRED